VWCVAEPEPQRTLKPQEGAASKIPNAPAQNGVAPPEEQAQPFMGMYDEDMRTGIAKHRAIARYAQRAHEALDAAPRRTPNEGKDMLLRMANDELIMANVPPLKDAIWIDDKPNRFRPSNWTIELNLKSNYGPDQSRYAEKISVSTVLHEARHAEQTFRIARLLAGQGQTAFQIHNALTLDASIAEVATYRPMQPWDPEFAETSIWKENRRVGVMPEGADKQRWEYCAQPREADAHAVQHEVHVHAPGDNPALDCPYP
jgi:hypothetical protein